MNCKPGDLAYIVYPSKAEVHGRYVTVLEAASATGADFLLPDGRIHAALRPSALPRWLCEFHNPVQAPFSTKGGRVMRETRYAPIPDALLRPIRDPGDDAVDEMLRPLPIEVAA